MTSSLSNKIAKQMTFAAAMTASLTQGIKIGGGVSDNGMSQPLSVSLAQITASKTKRFE